MLFQRIFGWTREAGSTRDELRIGSQHVPILLIRNNRARRYLLRVRPDGSARVTVPRGGSLMAAKEFAARHAGWLERQLENLRAERQLPAVWLTGTEILFRGETVSITAGELGWICFGAESVKKGDHNGDLRPAIEQHLRTLATRELPPQVLALAARENLAVSRITVRNQRSRWGSCSRRGTISLNWRLIQTPPFVQTYIFLHELLHLREMNHSARFWHEVERACPEYRTAERWLKQHSKLLR